MRQTSIQLDEKTEQLVNDLKQCGFGSFTDIVRLAITRLHNEEIGGDQMSKYLWAVQSVGRPYGPTERIPAEAWRIMARHTTKSAAKKRLHYEMDEMNRLSGGSGWYDHYRVVPLRDTTIAWNLLCCGWIATDGKTQWCDKSATVSAPWPALTGEPEPPTPEGWDTWQQCNECHRQEEMRE